MSIFRKIAGILLITAAIVGLLFSLVGLVVIWQVKPALTEGLQETVEVISATLATTSQALEVTQQSLESSVQTISSLESTVQTIATTVKSSEPMVVSIDKLLNEDLPATMEATYASLVTAEQSAAAIDGVLTTLSNIPIIGIPYDPEVPLGSALGGVAEKVSVLPARFQELATNLQSTTDNLERFEADLSTMAASIGQIESSVAQYKSVVSGYQQSLEQVQQQLTGLSAALPGIVNSLVWGLSIFLAWMAIAQIGLMTQGWELVMRKSAPRQEVVEIEAKEEKEDAQEAPAQDETEAEK
jgi:hypothetical protein